MLRTVHVVPELSERPGFVGPDLSPQGLELRPRRLGDGVYALLANIPPKDNNGLVVGAEAALVVDAGVTPQIGKQIQRLAARLTDRPIAYLANTTFHGDHTFGNAAFPDQVTVAPRGRTKRPWTTWTARSDCAGRACTPTRTPSPASGTGAAPTSPSTSTWSWTLAAAPSSCGTSGPATAPATPWSMSPTPRSAGPATSWDGPASRRCC
jgi:Metallo-beta-lactamase superfamily